MIMQKIPHQVYYLLELLALFLGFFFIFLLSPNFKLQIAALVILLILYTILGIVHHGVHHTLKRKILLEYVLVSAVILSAFLFLNISKF